LGIGLPRALSPDEIVVRAEWLIGKSRPGLYNLVGSNCEHLANWCVTGGDFESLQVRASFALQPALLSGLMFAWRRLNPRLRSPALILETVTGLTPFIYNFVPYQAWKHILAEWPGDQMREDFDN
jgi:hypothetical protein